MDDFRNDLDDRMLKSKVEQLEKDYEILERKYIQALETIDKLNKTQRNMCKQVLKLSCKLYRECGEDDMK